MTEWSDEMEAKLIDDFWKEFSALCWKFINKVPPDLRYEITMFLGEKTSIYGIADESVSTSLGDINDHEKEQ